jgi:hypothetical protein
MLLPVVLNLLAADRVVRDKSTGRWNLLGVFDAANLAGPGFFAFEVYFTLTEIHAPFDLGIRFNGPDEERLGGGAMRIPTSDPLATVHGSSRFEVTIGRPGVYRLWLAKEGEILAERAIRVAFVGTTQSPTV